MRQVELDGNVYRIGHLSPMRQFHIFRRLAPLIAAVPSPDTSGQADAVDNFHRQLGENLAPLVDAVGRLTDDEGNYIILNTLRAVERQVGNGWARLIASGPDGQPLLMFEDMDLSVMMQLVWATFQENLQRFFSSPEPASSVAPFPMVSR